MTNATTTPTTPHVPHVERVASGDWAWLGATAGSTADKFYVSAAEDWLGEINSRYVDEMLDDTLPEKVLKFYLIQDFKFFSDKFFVNAVKLAPRQDIKDTLSKQIDFVNAEEEPYFKSFLRKYHVSDEEFEATEQIAANREYCDELDRLADSGSFASLITAICCMEWSYLAWAKRTTDAGVVQKVPAHRGWVELHEGDAFREWVRFLIGLVNEYADPSLDGPQAKVFAHIARLEREFFEQSYELA